jgi:hypothetical protein
MNMRPPPLDLRERGVRLLAGIAWVSFLVVGTAFFFAPDGVMETIHGWGQALGDFPALPPVGARFWVALSAAYMAVVTALAFAVWVSPRDNAGLLVFLAVGKATSSLTTGYLFCVDRPAFAYLLNFLVDGSIAVVCLAAFASLAWSAFAQGRDLLPAAVPPFSRSAVRARVRAYLETLFPADPRFGPDGDPEAVVDAFGDFLAGSHPAAQRILAWVLLAADLTPLLVSGHLRTFAGLSPAARAEHLERMATSPVYPFRQLVYHLRFLGYSVIYTQGSVAAAVGYPGPEPIGEVEE